MNKKSIIFIIFITPIVLSNIKAYAYLDPGSGSLLIQVLAGSALVIGVSWRFIVSFIKKLIKKGKTDNKNNGSKSDLSNASDK